jgi:hypothetical protein
MERYTDVQFEFLSALEGLELERGVVIVRDGEMVLEVECPGDRRYSIRGTLRRDFFVGRHEDQLGDTPVDAKWIRLDDIYIGTWIEGGNDYMFRFHLPPGAIAN